jgi:hypothetical protein
MPQRYCSCEHVEDFLPTVKTLDRLKTKQGRSGWNDPVEYNEDITKS